MRRVATLSMAALLVLTTACSGGDKIVGANGETVVPPSSTLTSGDSVFLANFMSAGAWGLMKQMRTIGSIQVTGFGNTRPACTPQAVIGGLDGNGNGIPDDQTTTYAATSCTFLNAGFSTTANGSIRLQDLGALYGYRVTYTNYVLTGTKGDSSTTATLNGTVVYHYASTNSARSADSTTLVTRVQSPQGSATITRTAGLSATFTPNSGPFSIGSYPGSSVAVTGNLNIQLALTGNMVQAGYPATTTFNIAMSSGPSLTSPSSCLSSPSFTNGTINGTLTGTWQASLRVVYAGCGTGAADNPGTKR